jgi:hypothetical protein
MNKTWLMYGAIFLAGVVLAARVRTLPVLNKLPAI